MSRKLERALKLLSEAWKGGDRDGDFKSEYRYYTARGWAVGRFMAERLDNATIYGGHQHGVYMLTLLPAGSLAKGVRPPVLRDEKQAIVVNSVTIPV